MTGRFSFIFSKGFTLCNVEASCSLDQGVKLSYELATTIKYADEVHVHLGGLSTYPPIHKHSDWHIQYRALIEPIALARILFRKFLRVDMLAGTHPPQQRVLTTRLVQTKLLNRFGCFVFLVMCQCRLMGDLGDSEK